MDVSARPTKVCNHCKESVAADAKKCPHCQSDLRSWPRRHPIATILLALFGLPFIVAAAAIPSTNSNNQPKSTQTQAPAPTREDLKANVSYSLASVSVTNTESAPWGRCEYKLDNKYKYSGSNVIVPVNNPVELAFADFVDGNKRFNIYELKPKYLRIACYRNGTDWSTGDYFFN